MITAAVESFKDAIPELAVIFPEHWKELALYQDRMPLSPQYDEYIKREIEGRLFLTTVRKDGKIVAYYTCQISPGFHYSQTLTGIMDLIYVVPEHRNRGGVSVPLFRTVKRELRRRGVKLWFSGFKTDNPMGLDKLLAAIGFTPADSYVSMWLD